MYYLQYALHVKKKKKKKNHYENHQNPLFTSNFPKLCFFNYKAWHFSCNCYCKPVADCKKLTRSALPPSGLNGDIFKIWGREISVPPSIGHFFHLAKCVKIP